MRHLGTFDFVVKHKIPLDNNNLNGGREGSKLTSCSKENRFKRDSRVYAIPSHSKKHLI